MLQGHAEAAFLGAPTAADSAGGNSTRPRVVRKIPSPDQPIR